MSSSVGLRCDAESRDVSVGVTSSCNFNFDELVAQWALSAVDLPRAERLQVLEKQRELLERSHRAELPVSGDLESLLRVTKSSQEAISREPSFEELRHRTLRLLTLASTGENNVGDLLGEDCVLELISEPHSTFVVGRAAVAAELSKEVVRCTTTPQRPGATAVWRLPQSWRVVSALTPYLTEEVPAREELYVSHIVEFDPAGLVGCVRRRLLLGTSTTRQEATAHVVVPDLLR